MSRTIPPFLSQLAYTVDNLVETSGPEHWRRHVRQWAAQADADKREGLPVLDFAMDLSLGEKYALLAAVHDAQARFEGSTEIEPDLDGCYPAYTVLKIRVVQFPQAGEAGLDESQAPRLLSILREVAADVEKSSRLWTPDRTSDAYPGEYRHPVDEFERFLEEQSKPVEPPVPEPAGVQQAAREPRPSESAREAAPGEAEATDDQPPAEQPANTTRDGPTEPDAFVWQNRKYGGLPRGPFGALRYLWGCEGRAARPDEEMAESVYGDREQGFPDTAVRGLRQELNNFFRTNKLPFHARQHNGYLSIDDGEPKPAKARRKMPKRPETKPRARRKKQLGIAHLLHISCTRFGQIPSSPDGGFPCQTDLSNTSRPPLTSASVWSQRTLKCGISAGC